MKNVFNPSIVLLILIILSIEVHSKSSTSNNSLTFELAAFIGDYEYTFIEKYPYWPDTKIHRNWSYFYDLHESIVNGLFFIQLKYKRTIKVICLSAYTGIALPGGSKDEYLDTTKESWEHMNTDFEVMYFKFPFIFELSSNFPKIKFFSPFISAFIGFDTNMLRLKEEKHYHDFDETTIKETFVENSLAAGGKVGIEFFIPKTILSINPNLIYRYSKAEYKDIYKKNNYEYDCTIKYPGWGFAISFNLHL